MFLVAYNIKYKKTINKKSFRFKSTYVNKPIFLHNTRIYLYRGSPKKKSYFQPVYLINQNLFVLINMEQNDLLFNNYTNFSELLNDFSTSSVFNDLLTHFKNEKLDYKLQIDGNTYINYSFFMYILFEKNHNVSKYHWFIQLEVAIRNNFFLGYENQINIIKKQTSYLENKTFNFKFYMFPNNNYFRVYVCTEEFFSKKKKLNLINLMEHYTNIKKFNFTIKCKKTLDKCKFVHIHYILEYLFKNESTNKKIQIIIFYEKLLKMYFIKFLKEHLNKQLE